MPKQRAGLQSCFLFILNQKPYGCPLNRSSASTTSVSRVTRAAGRPWSDIISPHDLRRTASTLLHEAGYNTHWIEKCLAHEQRGVRAVDDQAEYAKQRGAVLLDWTGMVDAWVKGAWAQAPAAVPAYVIVWFGARPPRHESFVAEIGRSHTDDETHAAIARICAKYGVSP